MLGTRHLIVDDGTARGVRTLALAGGSIKTLDTGFIPDAAGQDASHFYLIAATGLLRLEK